MRVSTIQRKTKETEIDITINLDGEGNTNINTGVGFLDHMLTLFAFHGNFDLSLTCKGDLEVDSHHTVEDIGIALGQCVLEALGDKKGIYRYGEFTIPMDEALVRATLDISGRPYLVYNMDLPMQLLGNFETEMVEEFYRAFTVHAGITLHINELYGKNTHHIIEASFKAVARALKQAVAIDVYHVDKIMSSKGVL